MVTLAYEMLDPYIWQTAHRTAATRDCSPGCCPKPRRLFAAAREPPRQLRHREKENVFTDAHRRARERTPSRLKGASSL